MRPSVADAAQTAQQLHTELVRWEEHPPASLAEDTCEKISRFSQSHIRDRLNQLVRSGQLSLDEPAGLYYTVFYGLLQMLLCMRYYMARLGMTVTFRFETFDQVSSGHLLHVERCVFTSFEDSFVFSPAGALVRSCAGLNAGGGRRDRAMRFESSHFNLAGI
jgi:hypothetical protein